MLKMRGIEKGELIAFHELLTDKERQILGMIAADGLDNADIARALYLSVGTVKTHIQHILGKARSIFHGIIISNRVQLALIYREALELMDFAEGESSSLLQAAADIIEKRLAQNEEMYTIKVV